MLNYYYPYGMHYGFGFGGFFSFLWFIFIVWLLIKIFHHFFGHQSPPVESGSGVETPLDILKKRYARGEIDRKEFDQIKKDVQ